MPRRGKISKRDVLPDPMYGSKLVTKLINNVMYDGKKGVAQTIVYDAFAIIEEKIGPYGSKSRETADTRIALARRLFKKARRTHNGRKTRSRNS